jgi:hypothetical protein
MVILCCQPRVGLYLIFGLVLLFEVGVPDDLMLPGRYLNQGLQSTLNISGFIASPLELLLLTMLGAWLTQGIIRRQLNFRGGQLLWPMVLFFLAIVFGIVRGKVGDGDLYIAFWEARALLYLLICYLVAANTIRTQGHLNRLTGIALVAIGLFALEGAYRRIVLMPTIAGPNGEHADLAYAHDSVIFLGTLIFIVLAQQVFGGPLWQRLAGLGLVPLTIFTLLATQRRAGYIALIVAFLAITLVLVVAHRKAFYYIAIPVLVLGAIYLPLFWNNTSLVGQPARAVRSLTQPDPRDAASNEYRVLEKINVIETIHANGLLGVGFGNPFLFVVPLPSLEWWPFWHYEPHHNILWVWLKTGAVGFILFWTLMGTAIARAAHACRTLHRREAKAFALIALAGIIQTLVFCYVDLGLVDGRLTVFLGVILGALSVLDQVQE